MTHFELLDQFHSFYKSGKNICLTSDGYIIADDGEKINYIDKKSLRTVDQFNKRLEEITCFVANPEDYTVILATNNLLLKQMDRSKLSQRPKMFNSCHQAPIFAMCLNKNSTRLTTGGADNKVRIWHIGKGEGKSFSCIYHNSKINIVKNHPSLNMVVSTSMLDFSIVAWNTENGEKLGEFTGHQNAVTGIDFHEFSNQMATSSRDETIIIWNNQNFNKICLIPAFESLETCVIITDCINQPDVDDYLIMVGGVNGIMKTISPNKKVVIQEFKKASLFANEIINDNDKDKSDLKMIRSILQTTDSIIVVRESDNVEFYSKQMQLEYELAGDLSDVKDIVMVGKDKEILLTVESAPYVRLFSCKSIFEETRVQDEHLKQSVWPCQIIHGGHSKDITSVSVFSDGLQIVTGAKDGKVCIWKVEDNAKLQLKLVTSLTVEKEIIMSVCVDKNGKFIYVHYSVEDYLSVLSFKKNILTQVTSFSKPHLKAISTMAVNITSTLLATGSKDKSVKLWTYQSNSKEIIAKGVIKGHKSCISSVVFSENEQLLLTSSLDKIINLWSIETLNCIQTFQSTSSVQKALFYNNEKQIISCHSDGKIIVRSKDRQEEPQILKIHDGTVNSIAFIHDIKGKCSGFAVAGANSMMCLYKDETELNSQKLEEEKKIQIQNQQELDNLLFEKNYFHALKLAIKLNKPLRTYETLKDIDMNKLPTYKSLKSFQLPRETDIGKAIDNLDLSELERLFSFTVKWITNGKTFEIAELVIRIIFSIVPAEEICLWSVYSDNRQLLKSYLERNCRRETEELTSTGMYRYFLKIMKNSRS